MYWNGQTQRIFNENLIPTLKSIFDPKICEKINDNFIKQQAQFNIMDRDFEQFYQNIIKNGISDVTLNKIENISQELKVNYYM